MYKIGFRAFKLPPISIALGAFKSPCICADGRTATTFFYINGKVSSRDLDRYGY